MEELLRVFRFLVKEAAWRATLAPESILLDRSLRQVKQYYDAYIEYCYSLANSRWDLLDHISIIEAKLAKKVNPKDKEKLVLYRGQLAEIEGQLARNHETVELLGYEVQVGAT